MTMQVVLPAGMLPEIGFFCPGCRQAQARRLNVFRREITLRTAFQMPAPTPTSCTCSDRDPGSLTRKRRTPPPPIHPDFQYFD